MAWMIPPRHASCVPLAGGFPYGYQGWIDHLLADPQASRLSVRTAITKQSEYECQVRKALGSSCVGRPRRGVPNKKNPRTLTRGVNEAVGCRFGDLPSLHYFAL